MDSLIAEGVSCDFGKTRVVAGASLDVAPQRLTALLGGSGAGKSTLLRAFAGLQPISEGEIRLGNTVLSRKGKTVPAEQRRIGLVFQDFALFPHLTAAENIAYGLKHLGRETARTAAEQWLDRLGLTARAGAYPHQMSGGEQQRVAIARALAPEPAAILMDEPFSGLDPALRGEVRDFALSAVREAGIPALLVTHDADEAMALADHLAIMRAGRITQQGTPNAVYTQPTDIETAAALGPINRIHADSSLATLLGAGSGVREEGVRIDPDGPVRATVVSARPVGAEDLVVIHVEGHGHLSARVRGADVTPGDQVKLSFDPRVCFRF